MQSVLKTLNVMKWLPVQAETKPEKQLREDLVKKKKKKASCQHFALLIHSRQGEGVFIYVAYFMHSANSVCFVEGNPAAQDQNIQQNS